MWTHLVVTSGNNVVGFESILLQRKEKIYIFFGEMLEFLMDIFCEMTAYGVKMISTKNTTTTNELEK